MSEAQWERVFRAAHLRTDGTCPYGCVLPDLPRPEWTADVYEAYGPGPRRDPVATGVEPRSSVKLHVVRGVPALPPPLFATYRDAVFASGEFEIGRGRGMKTVRVQRGLAVRLVFVPR
jgi:hypothetical protein